MYTNDQTGHSKGCGYAIHTEAYARDEEEGALPWIEGTGEESPVWERTEKESWLGDNLRRALRRLGGGRKDDEHPGGVENRR
ncbi:hypothetical protein TNCV_1082961 [Trichonephila clavipes]|nr:hypothetical protein TNCV_1082961 [Trichonephila clavipes]